MVHVYVARLYSVCTGVFNYLHIHSHTGFRDVTTSTSTIPAPPNQKSVDTILYTRPSLVSATDTCTTNIEMIKQNSCQGVPEVRGTKQRLYHNNPVVSWVHHEDPDKKDIII